MLKRAQIVGEALSERFSRDPRLLADASGVYVRSVALHSAAVLFAPGDDEQEPPVIAISGDVHEPARSFLLAWALGLWVLGYQEHAIYWRVSEGPPLEGDHADRAASSFADAFLAREAARATGSDLSR